MHRTFLTRPPYVLVALLAMAAVAPSARGQMFGNRQLRQPLTRQPAPGLATEAGSVRGQRFLRGNRSTRDFVGSDRSETQEFVGMQQAGAGAMVRSAVAGIVDAADASYQLNRPATVAPADRPYDARLSVGFAYRGLPPEVVADRISQQLAVLTSSIEVSVEGRVATLRGEVVSAADRRLAELLAGIEPGISAVRNELRVAAEPEAVPPPVPSQDGPG